VGSIGTIILAITSLVRQQLILKLLILTTLSYNSAVFGSISTNGYWVFSVGRAFLDGEHCMNCTDETVRSVISNFTEGPQMRTSVDASPGEIQSVHENLWGKARTGDLERLEPDRCIDEYATSIQSNHRNLLIVSDDSFFPPSTENKFINGSHVYWAAEFDGHDAADAEGASFAYNWICSASGDQYDPCSARVQDVKKQESWRVGWLCDGEGLCDRSRTPVEYCLSEPAQPHCKLHFEPTITTVITILNLCKFICRSPRLYTRSSVKNTLVDQQFEIESTLTFYSQSMSNVLRFALRARRAAHDNG